MKDYQEVVELKVKGLPDFVIEEVKKIDGFCTGIQKNFDVLLYATSILVKDIPAFNVEYYSKLSIQGRQRKNIPCEFTIADFPLMNLNDLINLEKLIGDINNDQILEKATYIIGYGRLKNFIDCYFAYIALTDFALATAYKKKWKNPNSKLREDLNINDYVDGEILMKPNGVVFQGKNMKERERRNISFTHTPMRCIQH
ncbi:unnamed protein product [Lactuca saligna]|uniref:Uncharacterized protein n=1 Tax=Lactuca saligna TaxID=75948 RepID=A0AA35ZHB8_LACSI|nr:unnamed protein product [Lactuca saligna]